MMLKNYLINQRPYSLYFPQEKEFAFKTDKNYCFELPYLTTLKIIGERAQEFLQGQISCDVRRVTPERMQQGLICNLQGRILTLLDVIQWQGLHLILPLDLANVTLASLTKIAMLSRVSLELSADYKIYGLTINNLDDLLPSGLTLPTIPLGVTQSDDYCCYQLTEQTYIVLVPTPQATSFCQRFIDCQQMRGSLAWHQLQLKHKQFSIYPDTRGLFLPHRLDLHLAGYLSFDKGCYKGQEVIARMHYKAKHKHQLALFSIDTEETLTAGSKLFTVDGKTELGELIDYSPLTPKSYLIAVSILLEHPQEVSIENLNQPVMLMLPSP